MGHVFHDGTGATAREAQLSSVLPSGAARIIERRYNKPAQGWVDGVYRQRQATETNVGSFPFFPDRPAAPMHFTFHALCENTAAMDGDTASIGTFTYYSTTTLIAPMPARDWQVTLELANEGDAPVRARPLINELAYYDPFVVPASSQTTVTFTATLSKRLLELGFAPESDPQADDAHDDRREPQSLLVRSVAVRPAPGTDLPAPSTRIFVIADSICQTYFDNERPQSGWGEHLFRTLFPGGSAVIERDGGGSALQSRVMRSVDGKLEIHNRALGARSAKSYMDEGRLNEVLRELRPGDFLLFQMAPNDDTRLRPMRYEGPQRFLDFVDRYMVSALDRGVTPMLVTPCCTCDFATDGTLEQRFGAYRTLMLDYAAKHGIAVADLGGYGLMLERRLGPLRAQSLHMKLDAGQYANYPDGVDDNVHLNMLGAAKSAQFVACEFMRAFPNSGFTDFRFAGGDVLGVRGLTALVEDTPSAQAVKLRWLASPDAEYYTVTRREPSEAVAMETVTLNPWYYDRPSPDWPEYMEYEIVAWREDHPSPAAHIAVRHRFDLSAHADRRIGGLNVYEVDRDTFPGQIMFSVRFRVRADADRYTVVLLGPDGMHRELDHIPDAQVNDLHSYRVNDAPGLSILVEGGNAAGERFASDPVALS